MNNNATQSISATQPLPRSMATWFPVNYYLFVRNVRKEKVSQAGAAPSDIHGTAAHVVIPFYKAISNIL